MTGPQQKSLDHDYLVSIPLPFGDKHLFAGSILARRLSRPAARSTTFSATTSPFRFSWASCSIVVATVIGIPLGIVSALKRNTIYDYAGMGVAILGVSVPVIITAPVSAISVWRRMETPAADRLGNCQPDHSARLDARLRLSRHHRPPDPRQPASGLERGLHSYRPRQRLERRPRH